MDLTLQVPDVTWQGNEVEKRTELFRLGHEVATPGTDWLIVPDADELVHQTEAIPFKERLQDTSLDVVRLPLYQRIQPQHQWCRRLYRAQQHPIHVEYNHARYVTEDGRVLRDPSNPKHQVPCYDLVLPSIWHRVDERDQARNRNRLFYYEWARDRQIETTTVPS